MDKTYSQKEMDERVNFAEVALDIRFIKEQITEIKARMNQDYVTRDQFEPVRRITYGAAGLILMGVIAALLAIIIKT